MTEAVYKRLVSERSSLKKGVLELKEELELARGDIEDLNQAAEDNDRTIERLREQLRNAYAGNKRQVILGSADESFRKQKEEANRKRQLALKYTKSIASGGER